jgi:DNA repair exonuclease SbcCD ATPase subunit
MQSYALRFYNFLRFGEEKNSVVFDISPEDSLAIDSGKLTYDELYDRVRENPFNHISKAKERGLANPISIAGIKNGDYDKSNGVGKSTLLEAMCYARYNHIVRKNVNTDKIGEAGTAVVTKLNGKYPSNLSLSFVEEIFEANGKIYRIKRGRKYTKNFNHTPILEFTCYNDTKEDVDQDVGHRTGDTDTAILKVVGMDYDIFVNSVMFGQADAGNFLTGTDKTRKEMIVDLLCLKDIVEKWIKAIRDRKKEKSDEIVALKAQIEALLQGLVGKKTVEQIKEEIDGEKKKNVEINESVAKLALEIEKLSKSELVDTVEKIKEEGRKVKAELLSKKDNLESQVREWQQLLDTNKVSISSKENDCARLVKKVNGREEDIKSLEKAIKDFESQNYTEQLGKAEKAAKFKPEYEKKLSDARKDKAELIEKLGGIKASVLKLEKDNASLKGQIINVLDGQFKCDKCKSIVSKEHIEKEIENNNAELSNYRNVLAESAKSQKEKEDNIADLESKIGQINNWLIKKETITAQIEKNNVNKERHDKIKVEYSEDKDAVEPLKKEIEGLKAKGVEYVSKIGEIKNKHQAEIDELQIKINGLAAKLRDAQGEAAKITAQIESLKAKKDMAIQNKSTCDAKIGSLQKEIEHREEELKRSAVFQKKLDGEELLLSRLLFLEDTLGPEGIQTRIVKKYLPWLNILVKEYLDILTDGMMEVELSINDKNKVDITIHGGSADNYAMLSGGEKMVVRLATDIGLAMFSFSRSAQKPEMICLDEIFGPLDNYYMKGVFKLLARLEDKFSRVLVISHKSQINEIISNQILIEKQEGSFGRSEIKKISIASAR